MSENNNKQKRKRVCPHCGRKLWMREFYPLKNGGRSSWCHECVLAYKREQYRKHRKVADGTFMHRTLVEKPLNFDPFGHAELSLFAKI